MNNILYYLITLLKNLNKYHPNEIDTHYSVDLTATSAQTRRVKLLF